MIGWGQVLGAYGLMFVVGLTLAHLSALARYSARCATMKKKGPCLWRGWEREAGGRWRHVMDYHEGADEIEAIKRLRKIEQDRAAGTERAVSIVRLPPDETPTHGGLLKEWPA